MEKSRDVFLLLGFLIWMQLVGAFGYRKVVNENPVGVDRNLLNEVSSEILDASKQESVSYDAGKGSETQQGNEQNEREQGNSDTEGGLKNYANEKQEEEEDNYRDGSGEGGKDSIDKGVCICTVDINGQQGNSDGKEEESGNDGQPDEEGDPVQNDGNENQSGDSEDPNPGSQTTKPGVGMDESKEVNTEQDDNKEDREKTIIGGELFTFSPLDP